MVATMEAKAKFGSNEGNHEKILSVNIHSCLNLLRKVLFLKIRFAPDQKENSFFSNL